MAITCGNVIENFIAGIKEGEGGSVSSTKTVRIKGDQLIKMKEYQHLIGKIVVAVAIIVAAIIIAQAIGGAGESIRSGLWQLGDALHLAN